MPDARPIFTYGDKIRRRKGDCRVQTVCLVSDSAYHFSDGTFALIADQDCYEIVEKSSGFFLVVRNVDAAPLDDYLFHGYEDRRQFVAAIRRLTERWGGRVGRSVGERNGFQLLRFTDAPGGMPEEAWLPQYLLEPSDIPEYLRQEEPDPYDAIIAELDEAFGFE